MSKKIIIPFILLFIFIMPYRIFGDNTDKNQDYGVTSLYDYISGMKSQYEILNDLNPKDFVSEYMKNSSGGLSKKIITSISYYAMKEVFATFKMMGILIILAIISALLNNLQKAFSNENLSNIAYFACYSLIIVITAKSFLIGADLAKTCINSMTDFLAALIPVVMVLLAGAGGYGEAAVMDPIIMGSINLFSRIYIDVIIPIIFMGFVLQFVSNLSEEYKIDKLTKLFNQVALWIQGIVMTIFIGIVTVRGISSKTVDEVTSKTMKYAVDNFVPIVGKCISDAIASVAGYSLILKNAVTGLGLVIILIVVIFPIIKILIMAFLYKLTAAVVEPISEARLVNCINAASDSLILLSSCLISISVMFFIMLSILASSGKVL